MNTYEYQRGVSLFDLYSRPLRFILSNICCKATRPVEAKILVEPLWIVRKKVCSNVPGHMTKMAAMPIYDKKNF